MRHLYLMRHGIAEPGTPAGDFQRSLTAAGRESIKKQAERFRQTGGIRPDCLVCSTALRVRETAAILTELFVGAPLFYRETLYLAPAFRILDLLREMDPLFQRILIIGHNPGISDVIALLSQQENRLVLAPGDCIAMPICGPDWKQIKIGSASIEKIYTA